MDGNAQMDAMIERLLALRSFAVSAAAEVAPLLESELRAQAAAGLDPDGKPWPPKKDGGRALPNAASAISVAAHGTTVVATLIGPYVYHHYAKGARRRQILPDAGAGMPANVMRAVREGSRRAFRRLMGGDR